MRIGIVSTRICGSDGVSLEIRKWAAILRRQGHELYYCAGELDGDLEGKLVPQMHFRDPSILALQEQIFRADGGQKTLHSQIEALRDNLRGELEEFLERFHIQLLIVENALAIPMNVPLGLALRDLIAARRLPTIAHHHDFMWERERFAVSWMMDELEDVFPPKLDSIVHVVINSLAHEQLHARKGIAAVVIPNVFDFTHFHYGLDAEALGFRPALDIGERDWLVLQPTRIIPRKGIEDAIELVRQLRLPANRSRLFDRDVKLVLSHPSGDEGQAYFEELQDQAHSGGVPLIYAADKVAINERGPKAPGQFRLWDAYLNADFVAYPSHIEGFGNAFLEAVYYRLPLLIRRYPVFVRDIEPLGFDLICFDEDITPAVLGQVLEVMVDPIRRRRMTEWNFELGKQHFSYRAVSGKFRKLIERVLP
ncbi:MAG: mannosylglucosylglycerate synthase [Chloroflexota bacterium]|nr:mannosylglucosylglycerate synthase [Chloroflexota bacterium]